MKGMTLGGGLTTQRKQLHTLHCDSKTVFSGGVVLSSDKTVFSKRPKSLSLSLSLSQIDQQALEFFDKKATLSAILNGTA
jgi:hypothetical protein